MQTDQRETRRAAEPGQRIDDGRDVVLRVEGLRQEFHVGSSGLFGQPRTLRAVDSVSFTIRRGETLGLVGESGCGKSTVGRGIVRLYRPTAGEIWLHGESVHDAEGARLKSLRSRMQMVFQDPSASLNPQMSVLDCVMEPLRGYGRVDSGTEDYLADLLDKVGLGTRYAHRYPGQLSGGQKQRVGIARALALRPSLLVLDEAVSALDVSIQAQVLGLLSDLQEELELSYLFISHDLSVVRHISDRVAVMYLGRLVETGDKADVFDDPQHMYTQALLSAVPSVDPGARGRERIVLQGDLPSPLDPPSGCVFRTRCWRAQDICAQVPPELTPRLGAEQHRTACYFPGQ